MSLVYTMEGLDDNGVQVVVRRWEVSDTPDFQVARFLGPINGPLKNVRVVAISEALCQRCMNIRSIGSLNGCVDCIIHYVMET